MILSLALEAPGDVCLSSAGRSPQGFPRAADTGKRKLQAHGDKGTVSLNGSTTHGYAVYEERNISITVPLMRWVRRVKKKVLHDERKIAELHSSTAVVSHAVHPLAPEKMRCLKL